jgi:hypothetical protein
MLLEGSGLYFLVCDDLLLRGFGPYGIIFMMRVWVRRYNRCHGNSVKGPWP